MDNAKIDTNYLSFAKAKKANINIMLDIIRRCVLEINAADYTQNQVKDLLNSFTADWLENIIDTRHYYEVWYKEKIVALEVSAEIRAKKSNVTLPLFL